MNLKHWILLSFACIFLAACDSVLHTEIPETEANEMIALLAANGVSAGKSAGDKGVVTLRVKSSQFARAVDVLRENGYPKDQFNNLGTIFQQQGLISSPLEEHVRYVFGLSQTISETLSHIDGVITARVHIVVPEESSVGNDIGAPSAAVFLKTSPGVDLDESIPLIKELVRASVQGVSYESVVVTIFEADEPAGIANGPTMREIAGIRYDASSQGRLVTAVAVIGALFAILLGVIVYFVIPLVGPRIMSLIRRGSPAPDKHHPPAVSDAS